MKISIADIHKRLRYLSENSIGTESTFNTTSNMARNAVASQSPASIIKALEFGIKNNSIHEETLFELFDILGEIGTESQIIHTGNLICNEWVAKTRDAKDTQTNLRRKLGRITGKVTNRVYDNVQDAKAKINKAIKAGQANFVKNTNDIKNVTAKLVQKPNTKVKKKKAVEEMYIKIEEMASRMYQADRILENYNRLSKRFNIDRVIRENTPINGIEDTVVEICKLMDTYDIQDKVKFSMALETAWYGLHKNYIEFKESDITTIATDYFLSKGNNNAACKYILENSLVVDKDDYLGNLELITEEEPEEEDNITDFEETLYLAYEGSYFNEDTLSAEDRNKLNSSQYGLPDKKKYPMPDEAHVRSAIRFFNHVDKEDEEELARNIIKKMKQYGINDIKISSKNRFGKYYTMREASIDEMIRDYSIFKNGEEHKIYDAIHEAIITEEADFNKIFDQYKASNETNKETKLQWLIRKLFTRPPEDIIHEVPHILSWVRKIFVLGGVAIHPIVGAVGLIADLFIGLHMQREETAKMLDCFKKEIEATNKKLESTKSQTERERLQDYLESLMKGYGEINDYYETLLTEKELDAKYDEDNAFEDDDFDDDDDKGSNKSKDKDDDDDLDFGDDDDDWDLDDFDLEEAVKMIPRLSNLISVRESFAIQIADRNVCLAILKRVPSLVTEFTDIAKHYPGAIDINGLRDAIYTISNDPHNRPVSWGLLEKYNFTNAYKESADIKPSDVKVKDIFKVYRETRTTNDILNTINELYYDCIYTDNAVLEASFTNTVKLAVEKLKKTVQNLSDKEKAISRTIDVSANNLAKAAEKSLTVDNREAVIKGSILPSASKVIKGSILAAGAAILIDPVVAVIGVLGHLGISKKYKAKERQMVIDELEIELKMCEKYIDLAENKNDMEALKKLYSIQRALERQRQSIKYKMKVDFGQKYYDASATRSDME